MPGLTDNMEKYILQHIFKQAGPNNNQTTGGLPASPTQLFVSLHSADPTDVLSAALANELTGGGSPGYARAQLNPDANISTNTNWNAVVASGTAQVITNKAPVTFAAATGNWNGSAPITHFGLWSVGSSGTADQYWGSGQITGGGVIVLNGVTLQFAGGTPGVLSFGGD